MKEQILNGTWEMKQVTDRTEKRFEPVKGKIPGSVVSFLLENGQIEEPYYRDNELKTLPLFDEDYTFSRDFDVPAEDLGQEHQILRFDGVDTLSEIFLNDVRIGETFNMHRYYEFDVRGILREKANHLEVRIKSPLKFIREKDAQYHLGGSYEAMRGFPHLRKSHCMFGWDWGIRLPDEGIFRDVKLLSWSGGRIGDVRISTSENSSQWYMTVDIGECANENSSQWYKITLLSPDGTKSWHLTEGEAFKVPDPQIWWPHGLGEQPLYTVTIELTDESGSVQECVEKRIGLRHLTVRRRKDKWGETFAQEVNGQTFFAMGADYVPEDAILSRRSRERTEKLLRAGVECLSLIHI